MNDATTTFLLAYYLIALVVSVVVLVAWWVIFSKAGQAGWKCLIPVYNLYIMYKIGWGNGWLFLLLIVPIVNFVVGIILYVKLAQAFGKGAGYAVGLIFLPVIFLPMLAFGDAQYIGPQ